MQFQTRCVINADHPSLAGHFPGAAVVPGVVLLDEIQAALREWREGSRIRFIHAVKFLQPVKPDQHFTIFLADVSDERIEFFCRIGETNAVEGRCEIASAHS